MIVELESEILKTSNKKIELTREIKNLEIQIKNALVEA